MPRTPWCFFSSHPEPELAELVRAGRLEEFAQMDWDTSAVPDPQDPKTFETSKLDWSELERPEHAELLKLTTRLIEIRHTYPDFTDPRFDQGHATSDDEDGWVLIERGKMIMAVNFHDHPTEVEVGRERRTGVHHRRHRSRRRDRPARPAQRPGRRRLLIFVSWTRPCDLSKDTLTRPEPARRRKMRSCRQAQDTC